MAGAVKTRKQVHEEDSRSMGGKRQGVWGVRDKKLKSFN